MKRLSIILAYVLLSFAAVVGTFSLLALTSSSAYAHEDRGDDRNVNQTQPAKADGEVRIDNLAGTVRIRGWDKNQVRVTGTLGEDVDHLEFTSDDSGVSIRVVLPHDGRGNCEECSADLEIDLPAGKPPGSEHRERGYRSQGPDRLRPARHRERPARARLRRGAGRRQKR